MGTDGDNTPISCAIITQGGLNVNVELSGNAIQFVIFSPFSQVLLRIEQQIIRNLPFLANSVNLLILH